jgi:rhodanese-related sulfurtransferase
MTMTGHSSATRTAERSSGVALGAIVIVATGTVLGAAYNELAAELPWIARDLTADVARLDTSASATPKAPGAEAHAADPAAYTTDETDPMAISGGGAPAAAPALPEIPDLGRPILIELGAAKQFHDAGAAVFVDAREAGEYEEGHIDGAINLPYDVAVSDPSRLQSLDTGGRPIITYCGGGGCEMSLQLAHELMFMGEHEKVLVYEGGFPEWVEAGLPVARGSGS